VPDRWGKPGWSEIWQPDAHCWNFPSIPINTACRWAGSHISILIRHTSANGLPLGAESNDKFFKILLTDTGLVSVQLNLSSIPYPQAGDIIFTNKGPLAEQFVGQQLRAAQSPLTDPVLFYWQRTGGRQGEIDYIIQHQDRIVPVEIKSGKAGSMKSLHQFMHDKQLDLAVRINANRPAVEQIRIKTTKGDPVSYDLVSIPLYLAQQIDALIEKATWPDR
jgi:uncharacterized protein